MIRNIEFLKGVLRHRPGKARVAENKRLTDMDELMQEKHFIAPIVTPVSKPAESKEIPEKLLKYACIYTNGGKTVKIEFDLKGKKMNFYPLTINGEEKKTDTPGTSMI